MQNKQIFITGIGTEVGKTVISAIFVEALQSDYLKPIQSGDLHYTDTHKVQEWTDTTGKFHAETYRLKNPLSPHTSAELDNVKIDLDNFFLPYTDNHLVIEGAGGLLVPLNDKEHLTNLIKKLEVPVVLVSKNYLGSINHSLMTYEILKKNEIPMLGWVFNGIKNESGKEFILNYSKLPVLLEVEEESEVNKIMVKKYANQLKQNLIALNLL